METEKYKNNSTMTDKRHAVLIVDQTAITASFNGSSLFVNGHHILDADEFNDHPLNEIADNLANALGSQVETIHLNEAQLAASIASHQGEVIEEGENLDAYLSGYTNDDVWQAVISKEKLL